MQLGQRTDRLFERGPADQRYAVGRARSAPAGVGADSPHRPRADSPGDSQHATGTDPRGARRLPEALKEALRAHASARGLTLTAALVELLEQGLEASAAEHSAAALERELALARSELAETGGRLREAELRLQAGREREELSARSYRALAGRARQELASCPRCREPVRGSDLLVRGHCPHCGKALSSLLTPVARAGGLEPGEYLALLGALGAVVGFALGGTAESAG